MAINFLSSFFSSRLADQTNHFQRLYENAHNSCTAYLSPDEAITLSKTCRAFTGYLAAARSRITHLDLRTKKITDESLPHVLRQHPRLTSLRLVDPSFTGRGILDLSRFFEGRIMKSIELVSCGCLFDFPLESKTLIEKIHFAALHHFSLSKSERFPGFSLVTEKARWGGNHLVALEKFVRPLAAQLRTCESLKTLDFSLLVQDYSNVHLMEIFESLPATLESFGPFPTPISDSHLEIAMRNIKSINIQKCDLSSLGASKISFEQLRAVIQYLPFSQMSHVFITVDNPEFWETPDEWIADYLPIFEAVLPRLPTCQQLTALHLNLSAEQTCRLIPALPHTLTELGPLLLNEEGIALLSDKNLEKIESCHLQLPSTYTDKARVLLESFPLATMHQIILRAPFETMPEQDLTLIVDRIKQNKKLKTLKLQSFRGRRVIDFLPMIIHSIHSVALENLSIGDNSATDLDHDFDQPQITKALLIEKLRFWPHLRNVRINARYDFYITLESLMAKPKPSLLSAAKNKISSLFKKKL